MNSDDAIKGVLIELLRIGLLRIRAFGNLGNAMACSVEADHLHNLPTLIQRLRPEELLYYCNVERPSFQARTIANADEFGPLWEQLDRLTQARK